MGGTEIAKAVTGREAAHKRSSAEEQLLGQQRMENQQPGEQRAQAS